MPMMPLIGVRISWLMLARNSPLARLRGPRGLLGAAQFARALLDRLLERSGCTPPARGRACPSPAPPRTGPAGSRGPSGPRREGRTRLRERGHEHAHDPRRRGEHVQHDHPAEKEPRHDHRAVLIERPGEGALGDLVGDLVLEALRRARAGPRRRPGSRGRPRPRPGRRSRGTRPGAGPAAPRQRKMCPPRHLLRRALERQTERRDRFQRLGHPARSSRPVSGAIGAAGGTVAVVMRRCP